jgi:hypothetical protein
MSDPQIGASVEFRHPNNVHTAGMVSGGVVLGTPNKADISWFGTTNGPVNITKGCTQDDTLSADNTFRIVSGGV